METNSLRWFWTITVVLVLALAMVPQVDQLGSDYLDGALKRALAGFAIARGLNGVVSVAQGTEFAITPAGIGVNFAPGEILDPINDLIERFSWIMLLSSSALGVQKVLLSMSAWQGLSLGLIALGLVLLLTVWVRRGVFAAIRPYLTRIFLLLMILRFMMPMVSLANEWVYRVFLEDQYTSASDALDQAREEISALNADVLEQQARHDVEPGPDGGTQSEPGLVERARALYRSTFSRFDFEKRLEDYQQAAESISENTVGLIVVFIMQTVVFPLLFLWVLLSILKRLARPAGGKP